jgi:hypothetical protein
MKFTFNPVHRQAEIGPMIKMADRGDVSRVARSDPRILLTTVPFPQKNAPPPRSSSLNDGALRGLL